MAEGDIEKGLEEITKKLTDDPLEAKVNEKLVSVKEEITKKPKEEEIEYEVPTSNEKKKEIINSVHVMYGTLTAEIGKILRRYSNSGQVNDTIIDKYNDNYNSKVAEEVIEAINKIYNLGHNTHPLQLGIPSEEIAEENFFNKAMLEELYMPNKEKLIQAVGDSNFMIKLREIQKKDLKEVTNKMKENG